MTDAGRSQLRVALEMLDAEDPLTVGTRLRRTLDAPTAAAVVRVAEASIRARAAGQPPDTWWTPSAAEQASHPAVARGRASRLRGRSVADVTAGCGGDSLALLRTVGGLVAADLDATRLPLLAHNLGGRAPVVRADATRSCWRDEVVVVADPGRRHEGRRLRRLASLRPAVPAISRTARSAVIALPPALDLDDPDLPDDAECEFVQVDATLVEATLWTGDLVTAPRRATEATTGASIAGSPGEQVPVGPGPSVGEWLLEPEPALVRARLVAHAPGAAAWRRLDRRRALLLSAVRAPGWARSTRILSVTKARPKSVRTALRALDPECVEVVLHGLDTTPAAFLSALGNPATGPAGLRIHLVRTESGATAIITDS